MSGSGTSKRRRRRLARRDGWRCVWCAVEMPPNAENATVEHIVPRSWGVPADVRSLALACRHCNTARGSAPPSVWHARCLADGLNPDTLTVVRALWASWGGERRTQIRELIAAEIRALGCDVPPAGARTCAADPVRRRNPTISDHAERTIT